MLKVNKDKEAQILAAEVRANRDSKLNECDWAMMPDAPTDKAAWSAYRQELRDIPDQPDFPHKVLWPVKPAA